MGEHIFQEGVQLLAEKLVPGGTNLRGVQIKLDSDTRLKSVRLTTERGKEFHAGITH